CSSDLGQPFDVALAVTRAGNLFTTHTAVDAGFDRFAPALIEQYLGRYADTELHISLQDLLALGRRNPSDSSESFNMAFLAIRGSGAVNGVSRLHAEVSRRLFAPLFPRWPRDQVPVSHVTNGVHMPSWDSATADALWMASCGKERWLGKTETLERDIRRIPDAQLWQLRHNSRQALIEFARKRLSLQLAASGAPLDEVERAKHAFDPHALTIGFARRFATYKRPNLLLRDPERLLRLLLDSERPVQLIIAGKAHPADLAGQAMVQQWIQFVRHTNARDHVVFLSDYDMLLTEQLVQGVDVWLNTPRRPWEACGTSGMKALVNGAINLSELDGWWAEAYTPEVGWALGDGREHDDDPAWDAAEAEALYNLLEREVIPEFYHRDQNGIPTAWVARMRESMARLTPRFSADRAVREYTEDYYLPALDSCRKRAADRCALSMKIVQWRHNIETKWSSVRFGELTITPSATHHFFELEVLLGELDPDAVAVELYAEGVDRQGPIREPMERVRELPGATKGFLYRAQVPATRPAAHFTPRVIPRFPGVAVPLEAARILWQR
ncbi:MAG: alpha-glucan family phosphorylase, partial [Candidatus Omnitrophica bacterium]|nr:alpha-glucan family phosphorylase [Candidatus Omnitrophota bacterium]